MSTVISWLQPNETDKVQMKEEAESVVLSLLENDRVTEISDDSI